MTPRERKLESDFQKSLLADVRVMFPGCVILKNDSGYQQGIPDWLILWNDRWAVLEAKAFANAEKQPNQPWWVDHLDEMSFAAFVYPENKETVLYDLQQAFRSRR
jgi:hypothetical protein